MRISSRPKRWRSDCRQPSGDVEPAQEDAGGHRIANGKVGILFLKDTREMELYPYYKAPEKALERTEGMRASSSSAVSFWSFSTASTWPSRRERAIRPNKPSSAALLFPLLLTALALLR
jgi:hypothetical protein